MAINFLFHSMAVLNSLIVIIIFIIIIVFILVQIVVDSGVFLRELVAPRNLRSPGIALQSLQFQPMLIFAND